MNRYSSPKPCPVCGKMQTRKSLPEHRAWCMRTCKLAVRLPGGLTVSREEFLTKAVTVASRNSM